MRDEVLLMIDDEMRDEVLLIIIDDEMRD